MPVVFKYPISGCHGRIPVKLPKGCIPLKIRVQGNKPVLWCEIEEDEPLLEQDVIGLFTGERFDASIKDEFFYFDTTEIQGIVTHWYLQYED